MKILGQFIVDTLISVWASHVLTTIWGMVLVPLGIVQITWSSMFLLTVAFQVFNGNSGILIYQIVENMDAEEGFKTITRYALRVIVVLFLLAYMFVLKPYL